ncbi:thermonuclease family protein [Streptomyces sp. SLBN-8D4]|uniref:thermonuclease family protein n=1 Tax=Streptomyces sp. SLBN-8D4 TaxID=3377728 RepID=UPI003C7D1E48
MRVERDKDLKDPYDRDLPYIWNDHNEFVNHSLVSTGHAKAVLYQPNDKHWPTISQAGSDAKNTGAGLWSACGTETKTPAPPATPEPTVPQDSFVRQDPDTHKPEDYLAAIYAGRFHRERLATLN